MKGNKNLEKTEKTKVSSKEQKPIKDFNGIINAVKSFPMRMVAVAVAQDPAALSAIDEANKKNICKYVLVGDRQKIKEIAEEINIKLAPDTIIHEPDDIKAANKAVQLVSSGKAEIVMKGYIHTDDFLRAVLSKEWGLRTRSTMSHVFIWESKSFNRLIFVTDGAMNIAPDLVTKGNIIMNAVHLARMFGVEEPRVAVLTAIEMVNPNMPATVEATCLSKMNDRWQYSVPCLIDGPLALDNALSVRAAKYKKIGGPVAGRADILVVPDIEAGNILAKSFVYLTGGNMSGVIVGAKAPVVLTSRADSAQSKLYSIATAVLMSGFERDLSLKIGGVHD